MTIAREGGSETWTRNFNGRRFQSVLRDDGDGSVTEQFGPFRFHLRLEASPDGIAMPVQSWRLGPIAMPAFLAPVSMTREWQDEHGRFRFDVKITLRFGGLLAHYRGWLMPAVGSNTPRSYDNGPLVQRAEVRTLENV